MKKTFLICFFVCLGMLSANECTVVMGYKNKNKEPYIVKDNSGLYKELYQKALDSIGCVLAIERNSKKGILRDIETGKVDFYPGFNFGIKRAKVVHYIPNGLPKGFSAITRGDVKNLQNLKEIEQLNLKNLIEKGGVNLLDGLNIKNVASSNLDLKRAIDMVLRESADIFVYNRSQIDYFLKKYKPENIKSHSDLFKNNQSLYLGFSKKSKHIKEVPNKNFDSNKPLSIENYPQVLDSNSVAYKFSQALQQLKTDGTTDKLYDKYFK
jgi:ABC-type amino acid transport substrate-binding protein